MIDGEELIYLAKIAEINQISHELADKVGSFFDRDEAEDMLKIVLEIQSGE